MTASLATMSIAGLLAVLARFKAATCSSANKGLRSEGCDFVMILVGVFAPAK